MSYGAGSAEAGWGVSLLLLGRDPLERSTEAFVLNDGALTDSCRLPVVHSVAEDFLRALDHHRTVLALVYRRGGTS